MSLNSNIEIEACIRFLMSKTGSPLDLLTDISLNCDDEVLHVCETIREELSNSENKTSEVRDSGFVRPSLFSREFNQEIASENKGTGKRYLPEQKEWINE